MGDHAVVLKGCFGASDEAAEEIGIDGDELAIFVGKAEEVVFASHDF